MSQVDVTPPPVGSPRFFEAIVSTAVNPFIVIDAELNLLYASPSIETLLGWKPSDWVGHNVAELVAPTSLELAISGITEIAQVSRDPDWVGAPVRVFLHAIDGTTVPVDAYARDSSRTGIEGTLVQLTRAGAAQTMSDAVDTILEGDDLDGALGLLTSLVEHDITGTAAMLGSGWNGRRFSRVAGRDRILFLTAPAVVAARAIEDAHTSARIVAVLSERHAVTTRDPAAQPGGQACWCAPVPSDDGGDPTAALFIWRSEPGPPGVIFRDDIHHSVNLARLALRWMGTQRLLAWSASHDHLTGLWNRAEFQNRLDASAGQARSVLFCDLDDFKPVNETLGHRAGDRVLHAVAERMRNVCEGCLVSRVGGDEFAILSTGTPDLTAAHRIAHRVRAALHDPVTVDTRQATIGVTIGIAFDPGGTTDSDQLMEQADALLRRGKAAGKNQVLSTTLDGVVRG